MRTATSRNRKIHSGLCEPVHCKIAPSDSTGLLTRPQRTKWGSSYLWIAPLAVGLIGVIGYASFHTVVAEWLAIASSALGTVLFAIVLTIAVCGSIASAVIWWACQQELQANTNHQATMRQYPAMHGAQNTNAERRRAA